jgi:hypothetical protein
MSTGNQGGKRMVESEPQPKSECVSIRLPVRVSAVVKQKAAKDRRTVSNWLALEIEKIVDAQQAA